MPGHFDLLKSDGGAFRFNLRAANNQTILTSESYTSRAAAERGIESVRKNAVLEERFERKTGKNGAPYFLLRAANHEVIGRSEMYSTPRAMENGITSVRRNALGAEVRDLTH
jgi:uncharacterized protein